MKRFLTIEEAWEDAYKVITAAGGKLQNSHKAAFYAGAGAAIRVLQCNEVDKLLSKAAMDIITDCQEFANKDI